VVVSWTYRGALFDPAENELDPKEVFGFVYLITHRETGRKYIGKKFIWKRVKRKNKRVYVFSDWKDYYGSCRELSEEREKLGDEAYDREILHLCRNKAECAYMEMREQITRDVLLREDYYNGYVGGRCGARGLDGLKSLVAKD